MAHAVLLAVDKPDAAGGKIYNAADVHQFTLGQWAEVIAHAMGAELTCVGIPGDYAYPARELVIGRTEMQHQLFDIHAIRADLGYTDIVQPSEGLAETVRWYRDNPPNMPEEFEADLRAHYKTEDELAELDRAYRARLAAVQHVSRPYRHPYAHPKKPNEKQDHRKR